METLSLKAMHPEDTILVTQGLGHINQLKPYLAGQAEIFLALCRDKGNEEFARNLAQKYPRFKHLMPQGQSWHEDWRLQREQKERGKIISMESTRHNANMVERADESPKSASGM